MKFIVKNFRWFMDKIHTSSMDAWAGQSALCIIIAFFPFILLFVSVCRAVHIAESSVMITLAQIIPEAVMGFVLSIVNEASSHVEVAIISVSAVAALWAISRSMYAITKGLCAVYDTHETRRYLWVRIVSFFYTIAFFVVLAVTLVLLVFGKTLADRLIPVFPEIRDTALFILSSRFLLALLVLTLLFLLIHKVLPNNDMRLRELLPGALFSSLGWMIFSRLFSYYIDNFSNYSNLYGSLTAIVLLMLWLYFCMYLLFLGGAINLWLQKLRHEKDEAPADEEKPALPAGKP